MDTMHQETKYVLPTPMEVLMQEKYGPLMSKEALAEILDIQPRKVTNGFANNLPWTRPFRAARVKIGRKIYLNTADVAKAIQDLQSACKGEL